jgi:hypothetical protein
MKQKQEALPVLTIEIQGNGDIMAVDSDLLPEIFPQTRIARHRLTQIEWDEGNQWWFVEDVKTQTRVAIGFTKRSDALNWEQVNYQPGTELWKRAIL